MNKELEYHEKEAETNRILALQCQADKNIFKAELYWKKAAEHKRIVCKIKAELGKYPSLVL